MPRSFWAVSATVPGPAYCAPPICVTEPKPVVARPVQHSPMSPVIVVGPVFVIVEPASSAKESAVPSGTGSAACALPASAGVTATAGAIGVRIERLRDLRSRLSTMVISELRR